MTPCPVAAMLHYLAAHPSAHGPLFTFEDGAPLTRAALVTHLQTALSHAGIEHSNYTGHSFGLGQQQLRHRQAIVTHLVNPLVGGSLQLLLPTSEHLQTILLP